MGKTFAGLIVIVIIAIVLMGIIDFTLSKFDKKPIFVKQPYNPSSNTNITVYESYTSLYKVVYYHNEDEWTFILGPNKKVEVEL